ncbi:MAG: right-handed parallel beta-helix repeat-containing protein, partial [Clostridia bacterium]|nr:right-handed parallel beta-helix repeat-containing protein [Clostridia bacterium]
TTTGQGSPAIYSTANVTVNDAALTAEHSEGVVVEGSNSVTLNNVTLTDTNDTLNGQSTTYKNIFLYQSQSGDAADGTGYFTVKDSTITTNKGDTFFVTNNTAIITLENNEFINNDSTGYFLRAMTGAWGTSGSNGGAVTLTATEQDIEGDIYIDSISSLSMTLANGSSFEGAVTGNGTSTDVALTLDSTSTWTLTGDSYIKSLSNTGVTNNSNINLNGHTLYVNGTAITSTDYSDSGDGDTDISDDFAVTINSVDTTDNAVNSADVTVTGTGTATLYAAVYEGGTLISVDSAELTETNSALSFDDAMSYDAKTQTLKLFAWNGMEPVSDVYEDEAIGYIAAFSTDSGVNSVDVYYTQDYTEADETDASETTVRDGDTGAVLADGTGQVNFKVNLADGYEITSITGTSGTYKKVKKVAEDTYRVTQITADTEITINTALSGSITGFTGTFEADDNVTSITVSETDSFDEASLLTENAEYAVARDGDAGFVLTDGNGQINFVVNVADGYRIADVSATSGTYKNKKEPADTGITNGYRLTKVTADTTITITTEAIPEDTGDGIIHLNSTSIDATGVDGAAVSGTTLSLAASENAYKIEGTLEDGNIVVAKNAGDVTLEFVDDVSVTSSTAAALSAKSGANITLVADEGVKASFSSAAKKAI